MAVCNDSEIAQEDNHWKVIGEPTEGALRTVSQKANFDRANYQRLAVVPFESENKFMATLDRVLGKGLRVLVKGAPDRLLSRCAEERAASGATSRSTGRSGRNRSTRLEARVCGSLLPPVVR